MIHENLTNTLTVSIISIAILSTYLCVDVDLSITRGQTVSVKDSVSFGEPIRNRKKTPSRRVVHESALDIARITFCFFKLKDRTFRLGHPNF